MPWPLKCDPTGMTMPEQDDGVWPYLRRWLRPSLISNPGYTAHPPQARVKLDAMENPYATPHHWNNITVPLNRYPDAEGHELRSALKKIWSVPDDLTLIPGNGSDELILYLCLLMGGDDNRRVLIPEPSFVMYRHLSTSTGFNCVGVPLREDWQLDMPAMLSTIEREEPAIIWLAWPNNPTGTLYPRSDIHTLAQATSGLLVVDEAYHPYSRTSLLDQMPLADNVIVLRTLSKLGLAGLRVGAAIGPPAWMTQLEKIRLPYNIGSLPQAVVSELPSCYDTFQAQTDQISEYRNQLARQLKELPHLMVYPGSANFLLIRLTQHHADTVYQQLLKQGILIKNLHGGHPLLDQCLRVTVGLPDENDEFIRSLRELTR